MREEIVLEVDTNEVRHEVVVNDHTLWVRIPALPDETHDDEHSQMKSHLRLRGPRSDECPEVLQGVQLRDAM